MMILCSQKQWTMRKNRNNTNSSFCVMYMLNEITTNVTNYITRMYSKPSFAYTQFSLKFHMLKHIKCSHLFVISWDMAWFFGEILLLKCVMEKGPYIYIGTSLFLDHYAFAGAWGLISRCCCTAYLLWCLKSSFEILSLALAKAVTMMRIKTKPNQTNWFAFKAPSKWMLQIAFGDVLRLCIPNS